MINLSLDNTNKITAFELFMTLNFTEVTENPCLTQLKAYGVNNANIVVNFTLQQANEGSIYVDKLNI
jgi:hypothetical protein